MEVGEYPYDNYQVYKPRIHKKEKRQYITLRDLETKKLKTMSYARYLLSVKEKRILNTDETVDHIDNNKLNDNIENLQILTSEQNIVKYLTEVHKPKDLFEFICPNCNKVIYKDKRQLHKKQKLFFCSRHCSGYYYWKNGFNKK